MTRKEAAERMRAEMVRDLSPERLDRSFMTIDGRSYTLNEMMAEVDSESKLGNALLDSYIDYNMIDITDEVPVDLSTLN